MIILGFDPGLNHFGFGIIRYEGSKIVPISYGQEKVSQKYTFEEKLDFIRQKFDSILTAYNPDIIVIEKIYVAKSPQIALNIGIVTGVIAGVALSKGKKIAFLSPREIKKDITGKGQADKGQVVFMVSKILNLREEPEEDAVDALATAITYITYQKFNKMIEGK